MQSPATTSTRGSHLRRAILLCLLVVLSAVVLAPAPALAAYRQTYGFVSKWAFPTPLPSSGFIPKGAAFAPNGDLLVSSSDSYVAEYTTAGVLVNTLGSGASLSQVLNLAANDDAIWVVDGQDSVKKLDTDGDYAGVTLNGFNLADGIAVDASGCVYVADASGSTGYGLQISKYSSTGSFITRFGTSGSTNTNWLWSASCITIGPKWDVYVSDWLGGTVRKYSPNATRTSYTPTARWTSSAFVTPSSVAADKSGNVFVVDDTSKTITKLNSSGTALARWGGVGTTNGKFTKAWSVIVSPEGRVFVDDRDAATVQQFKLLDLGPTTSAAGNVTVAKGKSASFKYKADEDISSNVKVTLKIYKGSSLKATINCGWVSQGAWHTKAWSCKLAKATYTWKVYATDGAGHAQRNIATKTLKVK